MLLLSITAVRWDAMLKYLSNLLKYLPDKNTQVFLANLRLWQICAFFLNLCLFCAYAFKVSLRSLTLI